MKYLDNALEQGNMKKSPHVLLIDDDHILCMVIEEMLTKSQISITSVSSGQKGIKLLRKYPKQFDVIILDRMMPAFSGFDVLRKICLMPEVCDIPIILLTSHTLNTNADTTVMYSVFEVLQKPIDANTLIKTINNTIKETRKKTTYSKIE